MIDPTTDTTPIRTARDGAGHRVYTGGDLLGKVQAVRVKGPSGRMCTRWKVKAAALAFLAPGCPLTGVPRWLHQPDPSSEWIYGEFMTKADGIAGLLAYLRANQAPAVGFGPHPDVAAAPVLPRRRAT